MPMHAKRPRDPNSGFTLIELLIVVAIIGILAGLAAVQLRQTPQKAKEAVLKALRLGLTVDTRRVSCLCDLPASTASGMPGRWTQVRVTCHAGLLPWEKGKDSHSTSCQLSAWWRVQGAYVLTLAALTGAPGGPCTA